MRCQIIKQRGELSYTNGKPSEVRVPVQSGLYRGWSSDGQHIHLQRRGVQPGYRRGARPAHRGQHTNSSISAGLLGALKASVRQTEHFFVTDRTRIFSEPGERRPTQRAGTVNAFAGRVDDERRVGDGSQNPLGQQLSLLAIGVARHYEE